MPGLIDGHCHISFDEPNSNDELFFHRRHGLAAIVAAQNARKVLQAGVTGIIDADSIFEIGVDLRDAIEAGIVDGPRISAGSYALWTSVGGTAGRLIPDRGIMGYGKVVSGDAEIVAEVRRQIKNGADWIKVHVTGLVPRHPLRGEVKSWTRAELKLVCDTAHELGIPVLGHFAARFRHRLRRGRHGPAATRHADGRGWPRGRRAHQDAADAGVHVPGEPRGLRRLDRRGSDGARDVPPRDRGQRAMLRRAYDAGVPLLTGSESGFSITPYGDWHYRELEVFVRDLGLTPLQAIQCATQTRWPSRCACRARSAKITAGSLADLIVIDGDPSQRHHDPRRHSPHPSRARRRPRHRPHASAPRGDPPGWRVGTYGERLGRDVAQGAAQPARTADATPEPEPPTMTQH